MAPPRSGASVSGVAENGAESVATARRWPRRPTPGKSWRRERDEYLLALQRLQADFENYRKRVARQQDEQAARAAADLVDKLLPALDAWTWREAHLNESLDVTDDAKALRAVAGHAARHPGQEGLERIDAPTSPSTRRCTRPSPTSESEGDDVGETVVDEVLRAGLPLEGPGAPGRHGPGAGVT